MARSAMAKLTSLQMSRNWSSYAVLDTDEITVTDGANDIDTTASPREVGGTPRDQYHEILRVNPDSATAFFCFNEESSFISSYVRALYYSAVSLKVTYGDLATSELTHMRELCEYLQVDVVSASDLAIADYIGTSDPYCVIFWQGERIFKTPHVNRNLNPEWNCTFYIPLCDEDVHSCELRLCVYDYDGNNTFINDDFLGQVNLDQGDMPWNKGRKPFNYWTAPVRVGQPCTEYISARSVRRCRHMLEVTVKDVDSMRVISIREHSLADPPAFKIVNRLPDLRVRFRQLHTDPTQYPRSSLSPAEYSYYAWDNTTLPKVLAVSAVDEHGVESPVGVYSVETVGVDLAPLNVTALKNRRSTVSVKVIVEGHTRCLELSNPPDKEERRSFKQRERNMTRLEEMLMACRHSEVLFFFSGLNFSFIDETPREVICCALEEVSVYSPCNSSEFRFTLGHMQIDNMLDGAKYKVVLASSNSGRNSHLNEDFDRSTREAIPFLEIIVVPDADNNMVSSSGLILERLQINLQ
ncbi:Mctp2, partial [Symbiodinium microadriaticum]